MPRTKQNNPKNLKGEFPRPGCAVHFLSAGGFGCQSKEELLSCLF